MFPQNLSFGTNLGFTPLPENANWAVHDCLLERGFAHEAILDSYNFTGRSGDFKLNVLAFADRIRRTPAEYAGCTVYNATNNLADKAIVSVLAQTAAPFHIIHRYDKFSFWASTLDGKVIEPFELSTDIPYSHLSRVLQKYRVDFSPDQIVSVKQGRNQFVHPHLRALEPLQLALWAIDVTRNNLVNNFGQAVTLLRTELIDKQHILDRDITGLAVQMLGATILADTGSFGESIRLQRPDLRLDRLMSIAAEQYPNYFRKPNLLQYDSDIVNRAYNILCQIYYSGFVPDMLSYLYTKAYSKEQRKARGFYDTPLYLTRRIVQNIPIEFLPPEQRIIVDMGCGWGSFLIAGSERLSRMNDMTDRSLRQYIIGNDIDTFTAQLAGLGLLLSTSEDSWHIDHYSAMEWPWIETHQPGIIIGNPPFGGRREQPETLLNLMPEEGRRIRVEAANAHLDRAIRRVRSGGYIAMIMPQSFLASEAAPQLRRHLLENCDITEIWELPKNVFSDATVQPMVLFAHKIPEERRTIYPILTRNIQNSTIDTFRKTGIFTISNITSRQSLAMDNDKNIIRKKNPYHITTSTILSDVIWDSLRGQCDNLESVATIFPGTIRGQKKENKRWLDSPNQRNIFLLTNASRVVPRPWYINYDVVVSAAYPTDFEKPRLENQHILDSAKIILVANPNPSWGRRAKAVIERRGYHVSNSFWIISPDVQIHPHLTLEALTAIMNWFVSNAWIAEHRRYTWIERRIINTIPIPRNLQTEDFYQLTRAVQQIELAAQTNQSLPIETTRTIDSILRRAYALDDATYTRLRTIAEWDKHPQITLDPQPDRSIADYIISGIVESVQAEQGTICLWINGFDNLQTVAIDPLMPGWMLRPKAAFRAKIPYSNKRGRSLDNVVWNTFSPQQYTYHNEEDLIKKVSYFFDSDGEQNE